MIDIIIGGIAYTATLLSCYDGDTCKVKFHDTPEWAATWSLRFDGFDTPEIRGKCKYEKDVAKVAKRATTEYMKGTWGEPKLYSSGERGKYGRLIVSAPDLRDSLIAANVARPYKGGKRKGWCDEADL